MNIKRNWTLLFILGVASYFAYGGVAYAGGPFTYTSIVNGGNWNQNSTWNLGFGVPGPADSAFIANGFPVVITDPQSANVVSANDALSISGDLTVVNIVVANSSALGAITTSGATLTTVNLIAGSASTGTYVHDGVAPSTSTVTTGFFIVGSGSVGEFEIRGSNGPIDVTSGSGLTISNIGTLRITPTANGGAGLVPITGGTVTLGSFSSTLVLDDSLYTPQVGDSWTVVAPGSTIVGSFANLLAPAGVTISQAVAKAVGTLTITVTAAPASPVPATSHWGLAILVSLLIVTGLFYVTRRRRSMVTTG